MESSNVTLTEVHGRNHELAPEGRKEESHPEGRGANIGLKLHRLERDEEALAKDF